MKQENNLSSSLLPHAASAPINFLKMVLIFMSIVPSVVIAGTSGPAPVPPPPAFQISTSVLTLCRGVVNKVPVVVSNPGTQPMTSLQLGIIASKNIYSIGNGTVNQATVQANGTTTLSLPVFVSLNTSSLVSVGMSINYNYFSLYSDSEVRNVSFGVGTCPAPLTVRTSPVVTSGRIENITLNLTNTGSTTLGSISLRASMPQQDAAILTSQPIQVGTMEPGSSLLVNERVFIYRNASQSFPLNVSVNMYNGTSPVQLLDSIPLLSSGIINIKPSSTTLSPQNPKAGSIFSVSMILIDTGTAGASAVTVTPLPPNGISPFGSNSVFVGDMQVDVQTPVTITLLASGALAGGSYTIPVRMDYLNNLRENISTTINVPVSIGSGTPSNLSGTGAASGRLGGGAGVQLSILLVIVVIETIALVVLLLKRKKSERKMK